LAIATLMAILRYKWLARPSRWRGTLREYLGIRRVDVRRSCSGRDRSNTRKFYEIFRKTTRKSREIAAANAHGTSVSFSRRGFAPESCCEPSKQTTSAPDHRQMRPAVGPAAL
jgi:hypothetical protein